MLGAAVAEVMERKRILVLASDTRILEVAKLMAKKKISAVMVVEGTRLVGIFTERDAVHRVVAAGREAAATRLADVMTREPRTVGLRETFGYAMLMMHEHGFRHVPVIDGDRPIGMVSARKALDPELEEFESEAQRRKSIRRYA